MEAATAQHKLEVALVLGSLAFGAHAGLVVGCPHAARRDSIAVAEGQDRVSAPTVCPNRWLREPAVLDLGVVAVVEVRPIAAQQARGQKQVGRPVGERLVELEHCLGLERQLMFGHSAAAEDEL